MYDKDAQLIFEQYQQINEIANLAGSGQNFSIWDRLRSEFGQSKLGKKMGVFTGAQGKVDTEKKANELVRRLQEFAGQTGQSVANVMQNPAQLASWMNQQIPQIVNDARLATNFDVNTYGVNQTQFKSPHDYFTAVINSVTKSLAQPAAAPSQLTPQQDQEQNYLQAKRAHELEAMRLKNMALSAASNQTPQQVPKQTTTQLTPQQEQEQEFLKQKRAYELEAMRLKNLSLSAAATKQQRPSRSPKQAAASAAPPNQTQPQQVVSPQQSPVEAPPQSVPQSTTPQAKVVKQPTVSAKKQAAIAAKTSPVATSSPAPVSKTAAKPPGASAKKMAKAGATTSTPKSVEQQPLSTQKLGEDELKTVKTLIKRLFPISSTFKGEDRDAELMDVLKALGVVEGKSVDPKLTSVKSNITKDPEVLQHQIKQLAPIIGVSKEQLEDLFSPTKKESTQHASRIFVEKLSFIDCRTF